MLTEDSVPEICDARAVAVLAASEQEKNYYCQRCLNHGELNPRKGHKPDCGYLKCPCRFCDMVEERRRLNNMLSKKKVPVTPLTQTRNGKRVRDPHCARCSAHGVLVPLRGHKRSMCQFVSCTCQLCNLVETRRNLMAAQIKLRRSQQKTRDGKEPKIRRSRKLKDINLQNLNQFMMVVTTENQKRGGGTSTSPSPSSTTDTMSPALSISPPPSPPPPLINSLIQTNPTLDPGSVLAKETPIIPPIPIPSIYDQLLLSFLSMNPLPPPPPPPPPVMPLFIDKQYIELLLNLNNPLLT